MRLFLFVLLFAFSLPAPASVVDGFARIAKEEKGPFGLNILQGNSDRTTVASGRSPRGETLFQAAYRNEEARALAEKESFYLGNLFTTNYYELMGEYVFQDPYGNHPLDHEALGKLGAQAIGKANLMVQHWVLEKHYVSHFPNSKLSRSFKLRGIGGSEFEQVFANYFFNFYLGAMEDDFQYLPAYLLAQESPIHDSASLAKARQLIMESYDYFLARFGQRDPRVLALYKLRNSIHNQLSAAVIEEIDGYIKNHPFYLAERHTYLSEIRRILSDYFGFNAGKIAKHASSLGYISLKEAANLVLSKGSTPDSLVALSSAAAEIRSSLREKVPHEKRAATLALLADVARFLSKEIIKTSNETSVATLQSILDTLYIEGFLIRDNWEYFREEAQGSSNPASFLTDVMDVAGSSTLEEAFGKAAPQWLSVEPQMQYFFDNTLKSSSVAALASLIEKVR